MFTVKTNRGWGWSVQEVPSCPAFGTQNDAQRYCDLRTAGMTHMQAWDLTEKERFEREDKRSERERMNDARKVWRPA